MAAISLTCQAKVIVTRNMTSRERRHVSRSSKEGLVRVENTRLRSQRGVGLSTSRKLFKSPFGKQVG